MTREAEDGVKWPQAKEHLNDPELGGARKGSPWGLSEGAGTCHTWILDFWLPEQSEDKYLSL